MMAFALLLARALAQDAVVVEHLTPRTPVRLEVGVGVPQPVTVGLSVAASQAGRAYLQAGWLRLPLWGGSQAFGISSFELGWRVHWNDGVELSLFSGYRSALASLQASIPATLWLQTWYAGVFLGWNYPLGKGLEGAVGLGVEFAVLGSASMSFTESGATTWESSPALSRIARWPLPRVTLFRLSLR